MAEELTAAIQRQVCESLTAQYKAYGPGGHQGDIGFILDTWHLRLDDAEKAYNYWVNTEKYKLD